MPTGVCWVCLFQELNDKLKIKEPIGGRKKRGVGERDGSWKSLNTSCFVYLTWGSNISHN